jgi:hypothetical protein
MSGAMVPAAGPLRIGTGVSQALVPFPGHGMLASVTGYCTDPGDIDAVTVFTATIACELTAVAG